MNWKLLNLLGLSNAARRRAARRIVSCACYATETLETRALLAGNVRVFINDVNDMGIAGDNLANEISITDNGTELIIAGVNGTRINNRSLPFMAPLTDLQDIFVVGGIGHDIITVNSFDMGARNFNIDLGPGNDDLQILAAGVLSGNLTIAGGDGADVISAGTVDVAGDLKVFGGTGSDRILLDGGAQVGLSMRVITQEDNDHVTIDGPNIGMHLTVDTSDGADAVFLRATVERNIAVLLGTGPDGLLVGQSSGRRLDVTAGSGLDRFINGGGNAFLATTFSSVDSNLNASVNPLVFNTNLFARQATETTLDVPNRVPLTPLPGSLAPLLSDGIATATLDGVDPSVGTASIDEFGIVTYVAGADDAGSTTQFTVEITIFGSLVARLRVNVTVTE